MDGWLRIKTKLDTKDFDAQIDHIEQQMEEIEYKLKQADMGFEIGDTVKLEAQYEKLSNRLTILKQKQADLNKTDLSNVQKQINKTSKGVNSVIKKMSKWALGIFAIRSAYGFVTQTISTLSNYNDKLAKDVEYIRFALASALQPVIEKLIQWVYKLLQYINLISKSWFGVNLFANATAEAMAKTSKNAKEVKKSLAGFDEMNTISSSNTADSVLNGSPSINLSTPEDVPVPSWLQFILDNKDLIMATLGGIAGGLAAISLGLKGIKAIGIGILVYGIILLIQDLKEYLSELDASLENNGTSWEDFGKIVTDIGVILVGLGLILGNIPLIIAGILALIIGLVLENWNNIKEWFKTAWNWIDEKLTWLEDRFGLVGQMITNPFRIGINAVKDLFRGLFTGVKDIFDGILLLFKGDFKNGFISIGKGILNLLITIINQLINGLNLMITPVRALIVGLGSILGKNFTMDNIKIPSIKYLKSGGIINYPGKGVPIGGARGGEAGKEGVLPLTDTQAMEELGSTIGRYVSIPLTNVIQVDGRTFARFTKKVQANKDFATNS